MSELDKTDNSNRATCSNARGMSPTPEPENSQENWLPGCPELFSKNTGHMLSNQSLGRGEDYVLKSQNFSNTKADQRIRVA